MTTATNEVPRHRKNKRKKPYQIIWTDASPDAQRRIASCDSDMMRDIYSQLGKISRRYVSEAAANDAIARWKAGGGNWPPRSWAYEIVKN